MLLLSPEIQECHTRRMWPCETLTHGNHVCQPQSHHASVNAGPNLQDRSASTVNSNQIHRKTFPIFPVIGAVVPAEQKTGHARQRSRFLPTKKPLPCFAIHKRKYVTKTRPHVHPKYYRAARAGYESECLRCLCIHPPCVPEYLI